MTGKQWVFLAGAGLLLAGCNAHFETGPDITENRTVEVGGAESARVQIEMGAGELRLDGGGEKLLDADFRYRVQALRPVVKYDVTGRRGYLTVRQPQISGFGPHGKDAWDLRVNDRLPLDLLVHMGAGHGVLKLAGMALRRLEVEMGAGELNLDLTGFWDNDLDARISGGVGQATVRLPRDVGVRVKATGGIGEIKVQGLRQHDGYYVNDAYEKQGVRMRIDISGGIGQINLIADVPAEGPAASHGGE
jgi:hypothetical protein